MTTPFCESTWLNSTVVPSSGIHLLWTSEFFVLGSDAYPIQLEYTTTLSSAAEDAMSSTIPLIARARHAFPLYAKSQVPTGGGNVA